MSLPVLYYIHDPMCSWCWGFRPAWQQVEKALTGKITIQYVLGGLAADNDFPMPVQMQARIKDTWLHIQKEIPGTEFNFDFWTQNKPRRSTYPACRAIIAAGLQEQSTAGKNTKNLLFAIQQAYYLDAKNPSDSEVLVQLSKDLGLDAKQFKVDLDSEKCEQLLQQELQLTNKLGASSFPSLVLNYNGSNTLISIDYNNSETIISSILKNMKTSAG